MVGIAQSAERQVVVLEVMGSIPITHPISLDRLIEVGSCEFYPASNFERLTVTGKIIRWDVAKLVRHQTLTLAFVGSSPPIPASKGIVSKETVLFTVMPTLFQGSTHKNENTALPMESCIKT